MKVSILKISDCGKYDFNNFLWSPDFFQKDKLNVWNKFKSKSSNDLDYYFENSNNIVKTIKETVFCYDLTDGLTKFFDSGKETNKIGSDKKIGIEGEFAISRMGCELEEMGIIEKKDKKQLFSTEFLIFRAKSNKLSTQSLFSLCMSSYVQTIFKRSQYGTIHPRFYDFVLEKLPIPDVLLKIDKVLKNTINQSLEKRELSRISYQKAHRVLLSEIGLDNWFPKHKLTFIKFYSKIKIGNARFDAEYYQPKYDKLMKIIKGYSGGWDTLNCLASIKKCIEVGSDNYLEKGIPFTRVSNINPFEITEDKYITGDLYQEKINHQPEKGEILFTKDATPCIASYLINTPKKMILSSGILRLKNKSKIINNETLFLILNSISTKEQMNRDVGGSVILHWLPEQVKELIIPIPPKNLQLIIQKQIIESFTLHEQSRYLLKIAKQTVEIAIEQGEKKATKWLNNEIVKL